jgi:hypothetical protein
VRAVAVPPQALETPTALLDVNPAKSSPDAVSGAPTMASMAAVVAIAAVMMMGSAQLQ